MRPIDADALEKYLNARVADLRKEYGDYDAYTDGVDDALAVAEMFPTLSLDDLQPKGKWKLLNNGNAICSACGKTTLHAWDFDNALSYCPHCGARLGGGE